MNDFLRTTDKNKSQNSAEIHKSVAGVLKPQSRQDVINFVKDARLKKMILHPVSTGKNWGYGGSTPYAHNSWILDLSEMNQIIHYDPKLHTVRIQPGVTQKQLFDFLERFGHQHLVPTTGAGNTVSLLGNALERGYGLTPATDHFLSLTAIEAVLPTGEFYENSLLMMDSPQTAELYKWGVGPYFDGLFSQSDLGIVTEATILLQPRPENVSLFYCPFQNQDEMKSAIPLLRELFKNYGSLIGGFNLLNNLRSLSIITKSPAENIKAGQALTNEDIAGLEKKHGISPWTMVGTFYGTKKMERVFQSDVKQFFKNHKKPVLFFDEEKQERIQKIVAKFPLLKKTSIYTKWQSLTNTYNLICGMPNDFSHQILQWRNPKPSSDFKDQESINPDSMGLIWYSPVVALKSSSIRHAEMMINQVCRKHGFDPLITFTANNPRFAIATLALVFNRENQLETTRAEDCYRELYYSGRNMGIVPYRYGLLHLLADGSNELGPLHEKIKQALDPDGILSPGRF